MLYGGRAERRYNVALNIVAMGDRNAVDIAQRCHERLLDKYGCLKKSDQLIYGDPLPRGGFLEGAYIGDHLVVGGVDRSDVKAPGRDL